MFLATLRTQHAEREGGYRVWAALAFPRRVCGGKGAEAVDYWVEDIVWGWMVLGVIALVKLVHG